MQANRGMADDRLCDDSGMTLVEILVATVILFIILTGVLGVVGQSTSMSVQAKQQNVLTNSLSAYVEWLHTLPFEDVALVADGGVLAPADTLAEHYDRHNFSSSEGDFTVTITPVVTAGANEYLKNVQVTIAVIRADGIAQDMTTTVVVRDRAQHMTEAALTPELAPMVRFVAPTPPDKSVVYGNWWLNGATPTQLALQIEATPAEGRTIEEVYLFVGSVPLFNTSVPATPASWQGINADTTWISPVFYWDTAQMSQHDDGTLDFANGPLQVTALVIDNIGSPRPATWNFVLDNVEPAPPGPPIAAYSPSPPQTLFSWTGANPNEFEYEFDLRVQGAGQLDTLDPFDGVGQWTSAAYYDGEELKYAMSTSYFSRYVARVFAKGWRFDMTADETHRSPWVAGDVFTTRPLLSGDYTVAPNERSMETRLSVTPPTFPTVVAPRYTFYRVYDAGLREELYSGTMNTYVHNYSVSNPNYVTAQSFVVEVTYVPDGYAGGEELVITSNTVTTTNVGKGTRTLGVGTW